jgi:hypothetical protein
VSADLAALLGGARERVPTARATLRTAQDPAATLRAWSVSGPWQAEAAAGDYAAFGMTADASVEESRQWIDRAGDRAREERDALVLVRVGPRWWRSHPGIGAAEGTGAVEVAVALERWTDPAPLLGLLVLAEAGSASVCGRAALRVVATPRDDPFDLALTPLGWGAARWELTVDEATGMLLGTVALTADGEAFRRVEAVELGVGEALADELFSPP